MTTTHAVVAAAAALAFIHASLNLLGYADTSPATASTIDQHLGAQMKGKE